MKYLSNSSTIRFWSKSISLWGTLEDYFRKYEAKPEYDDTVEELRGRKFADDVHLCRKSVQQKADYKEEAITMLRVGGISLHKWHSNFLETEICEAADGYKSTYEKERFGTKLHETKVPGVSWNER